MQSSATVGRTDCPSWEWWPFGIGMTDLFLTFCQKVELGPPHCQKVGVRTIGPPTHRIAANE